MRAEFAEDSRENEGVFEALTGASTLVGASRMCDISEKANLRRIVGWCFGVIENPPSGGVCPLLLVNILSLLEDNQRIENLHPIIAPICHRSCALESRQSFLLS